MGAANHADCVPEGSEGQMELIYLLVIGTSLWVLVDANSLGVKKGKLNGGLFDMGPAGWFFACLLLWIVAFPVYLGKRNEYQRLRGTAPRSELDKADVVANSVTERLANSITQLERLAQLKDKGIISGEEFLAKKRELL